MIGVTRATDPESLLSGAEAAQGFTYENSRWEWQSQEDKWAAERGELSTEEILLKGPRVFRSAGTIRLGREGQ